MNATIAWKDHVSLEWCVGFFGKAQDHVHRYFLCVTQKRFQWARRDRMYICMSSTYFSILVNDSAKGFFLSSSFHFCFCTKGLEIRQPIFSFHFFTIVTMKLSRSFIEKKAIRIIQGCSDCILISGNISCSFHKQLHLLMQPDWWRDLPKCRHLEANTNTQGF